MKGRALAALLVWILCPIRQSLIAEEPPSEALVLFGNGVWTAKRGADKSTEALRLAFKDRHFPLLTNSAFDLAYPFDYSYNHTACIDDPPKPFRDLNCFIDLLEGIQQAAQAGGLEFSYKDFWRSVLGLPVSPSGPDLFATTLQTIALAFNPLAITAEDLAEQVETYSSAIDGGTKVLLVAHSQGNFFGNQAYTFLSPAQRRSFGLVSVATPANLVAGGGPHTTLIQDFIHRFPNALSPNVSSLLCGLPLFCHGFIETYLDESEPREKILDDMLVVLESLPDPVPKPPLVRDALLVLDSFFDRLLRVDPQSGESRSLMLLSHEFLSGLAADPTSGLLYSVDKGTNELVVIDVGARSERSVGVVGISTVQDLTFGPEGVLYGVATGAGSNSQFLRIDTHTGIGFRVGGIVSGQFSGLAYDLDAGVMYATKSFAGGLFAIAPSSGAVQVLTTGLGGGVVYMADIPGSNELFAVGNSTSNGASLIGRFDPAAPVFSTFARFSPVRSITGLEMTSLEDVNLPANEHAVIGLLGPVVIAEGLVAILWMDDDRDDDASVSLAYSADPSCAGAALIVEGLLEDDEHDQYLWNTTQVPEGQYYVRASITDGVNREVFDCSRWTVTVDHVAAP